MSSAALLAYIVSVRSCRDGAATIQSASMGRGAGTRLGVHGHCGPGSACKQRWRSASSGGSGWGLTLGQVWVALLHARVDDAEPHLQGGGSFSQFFRCSAESLDSVFLA